MEKVLSDAKIQQQLLEWQMVYEREMLKVKQEGATVMYNSGPAMSPHLKAADLAAKNIMRLLKALGLEKEAAKEGGRFADFLKVS